MNPGELGIGARRRLAGHDVVDELAAHRLRGTPQGRDADRTLFLGDLKLGVRLAFHSGPFRHLALGETGRLADGPQPSACWPGRAGAGRTQRLELPVQPFDQDASDLVIYSAFRLLFLI